MAEKKQVVKKYVLNLTLALTNLVLIVTLHSYRKIPGDKCEGGNMPERKEIDLSERCVSDLAGPQLLVSFQTNQNLKSLRYMCNSHVSTCLCTQSKTSSKSVPIVVAVVIVMLLSVAGGVIFVKKYICGGRLGAFLNAFLPSHFASMR